MAIYLDEQTGPHIKMLLKRELKRLPKDFVSERLLKMVEADDERKSNIASCEHSFQTMYGIHAICPQCGGLKNGYEAWVAKDYKDSLNIENAEPVPVPNRPIEEQTTIFKDGGSEESLERIA